jgi:hypothetical protein
MTSDDPLFSYVSLEEYCGIGVSVYTHAMNLKSSSKRAL